MTTAIQTASHRESLEQAVQRFSASALRQGYALEGVYPYATGDGDINQVPRFHSQAVLAACVPCEHVVDLPRGGHGAYLSPLPPFKPDSIEAALLNDPPGFDRATLAEAIEARLAAHGAQRCRA